MNSNTIMSLSNYNGFVRMNNSLFNSGVYTYFNTEGSSIGKENKYNTFSYNNSSALNNLNELKSQMAGLQEKYLKNIEKMDKYTKESSKFYSDFTEKFSNLKTSSSKLKEYSSNSVFKANGYESTNSDVLSVKDSSKYYGKAVSVEVENVATSQTTVTNELDSEKMDLLKTGTLFISNKDKTYTLDLNLLDSANNKDAIKKISEEINSSNVGIKAQIIESSGKSRLAFTSVNTGEDAEFSVKFGGNLESSFTVSNSSEAKNANYKINDVSYTSQSNNVKIGDNLEVVLNGSGKAGISDKVVNSSKIIDAVKKFADDYNGVVSFLKDNSNKSTKIGNLSYSFNSNKYLNNSLSSIGIQIDSDGKVAIDEKKLKSEVESNIDNVKKVLGNSSGFATSAYYKASEAMKNGKNLYPQFKMKSDDIGTYSFNNSNVILSQYNSVYNNGLFLNYLL